MSEYVVLRDGGFIIFGFYPNTSTGYASAVAKAKLVSRQCAEHHKVCSLKEEYTTKRDIESTSSPTAEAAIKIMEQGPKAMKEELK